MRAAVICVVVAMTGCPGCGEPCNPEIDDNCAGGQDASIPPDYCNTPEEAVSDTEHCVLRLECGIDAGRLEYIQPADGGAADQDWYSASFGTLSARSLLRVVGGYVAPSTPVALSVTVLREGGTMSLIRQIDDHGTGAPRPIDILIPYTQSNSKLLFLVADKGGRVPAVYDVRSPYFISVCTQDNPDPNEPNDLPDAGMGGTPIPIPVMGAELTGTLFGYLATDNDVDRFVIDVPPNMPGPRNIIHVSVTTQMALTPAPPYRLSFTLFDPNGVPIAEQVVANAFLQADLATAKLIKVPGRYTVVVRGYKSNPNDPTVVPGDLRQRYDVTVRILRDEDATEPNDTMAEAQAPAKVVVLGLGTPRTLVGRLSYVPDPEIIAVDLPPNPGAYSTLYVRLTRSQTMGRFAALAGPQDRQLRILSPVAGAGAVDGPTRCKTDVAACPRGHDPGDMVFRDLVSGVCDNYSDAGVGHCLWLERNQDTAPNFANLRNMAGIIPVPPHGGDQRFYVIVGDEGSNYADDVEWTLTLLSEADPDEARFTAGPIMGPVGNINGVVSHGMGRTVDYDLQRCAEMPMTCEGARAPNDYDAVFTDLDDFTFDLPSVTDESWNLSWDVFKVDAGQEPGQLLINLVFCGAGGADGGCTQRVQTTYVSDNFSPWYSTALTDRIFGWDRQDLGDRVRVTARPSQCLCFQGGFTRMQMSLGIADRNYYAPLRYAVTQSASGWTGVFPGDGGVPTGCGRRQPDGGLGTYACGLP